MKPSDNLVLNCFLLCFITMGVFAQNENENITFDKEFVGVAFSPYVKDWVGDQTPKWNSYGVEELKIMLNIVSTKFRSISTYGMGVAWFLDYESAQGIYNKTLDEVDSNGKISKAAALLNSEKGELCIIMSQGIQQIDVDNLYHLQRQEIDLAILASVEANKIHAGTVWGLTFTNNYVTDVTRGNRLFDLISQYKTEVKAHNLKIGIRINNCQELANNGANKKILVKIIFQLDYVMCILHPKNALVQNGAKNAVMEVAKIYFTIESAIKKVKSNIEIIIGETGWPSKGKSYNDSPNNIANLKSYWIHMAEWAKTNKVKVQMFEAFDEPWKSDVKIQDTNNPGGFYGAERHYGWWRRKSNDDPETYVEKIYDSQENEDRPAESSLQIMAIFVFLILMMIGFCIMFLYFKRRLHHAEKVIEMITDAEIELFKNGFQFTEHDKESDYQLPLSFPYDKTYELEKNNFQIDKNEYLGRGAFGIVYKGKIHNVSDQVAFKTIKAKESNSGFHLKNLLSEIKIMIYIGKHENIVCLLGAYTSEVKSGTLLVATEFCELGSLEEFLRKNKAHFKNSTNEEEVPSSNAFEMMDLLKWSFEIANAMSYLENKKVVHADLAARNILLTANRNAKVTDFGLSRRMYEYTEYVKSNQEPLPWRWMAIETLQSMTFSSKSDVWSYGITLWEIFSLGSVPYSGLSWSANFADTLEEGLRLHSPKHAPTMVFSQMERCWELEPDNRPSFKEVTDFFQAVLKSDESVNVCQYLENGEKQYREKVNYLNLNFDEVTYTVLEQETSAYQNS